MTTSPPTLKSLVLAAGEFELDDHTTEWAQGIVNENQRLTPLLTALADVAEAAERWRDIGASQDTTYLNSARIKMFKALDHLREHLAVKHGDI